MFTLTFVRLIDLVTPLNINGGFYNTAIIKQIISHVNILVPYPCFEIEESSNSYPNPVKTEKTR